MGMFDNVVVLDERLHCPDGHRVSRFQTKSFADPSMGTYLVEGKRVYLVVRSAHDVAHDAEAERWQLKDDEAVFRRQHAVEVVVPPREVLFYTACDECAPVLVRCDRPRMWGDLIEERHLWVAFRATFAPEGQRLIERTSGTREDYVSELRENGLRVLRDDEPLAIAHREIRSARDSMPAIRSRARR